MENADVEDRRVHPRVLVDVTATFRQRRVVGTWRVTDLSTSGFAAAGDLNGLDLAAPVHVRVGRGEHAFQARALHAWAQGHTREGLALHGWAFLDLGEEARDELGTLLVNPRTGTPAHRGPEGDDAIDLPRFLIGLGVGLALALALAALLLG